MLDDLEKDLEKLDQLILEHRISKEEVNELRKSQTGTIRKSQSGVSLL